MTIGTKSILFGAHQFAIHPWFVAAAWWKLYGFPFDPRLWVAFFVHDLGYWGKPNMDGDEGEEHVVLGARIMSALFDGRGDPWCRICLGQIYYWRQGAELGEVSKCGRCDDMAHRWYHFCLFHSRFYAKRHQRQVSSLCYADKLAIILTPAWLYLPMTRLTGELAEYMERSEQKEGAKYAAMVNFTRSDRQWYENMRQYMRGWLLEEIQVGRLNPRRSVSL